MKSSFAVHSTVLSLLTQSASDQAFLHETYGDFVGHGSQNSKTWQGKYFNPCKVSYAVKGETQVFLISE